MTLRFIDSFDHYLEAQLTRKGWTLTGGSPDIVAAAGRRGTQAMTTGAATPHTRSIYRSVTATDVLVAGLAVNVESFSDNAARNYFLEFADSGTPQVSLRLNSSRQIEFRVGGTLVDTSVAALSTATWHYVEMKVTIHASAGAYEIRLDGVNVLSDSGVDTQASANASVNEVAIMGRRTANAGPEAVRWSFDDLYICDDAGSVNNDFLGDVRVDCYMADGNGSSSDFVGSDSNSTDNYLLVDDPGSPDDDSTYTQSNSVGAHDSYAAANISHLPSIIHGAQLNLMAKKADSGARTMRPVVRSGGSDYLGTGVALTTSYVNYLAMYEEDPDTAAAWSAAGFNAAEFGLEVES